MPVVTPQVNAVSAVTKFLLTKEKEAGQRKFCKFKARLPHSGKHKPESIIIKLTRKITHICGLQEMAIDKESE